MNQENKQIDDLEQKVEGAKLSLEEERELLDQLAEECMRTGKNFADDHIVMEQSKKVDRAIIELHDLKKMLEQAED